MAKRTKVSSEKLPVGPIQTREALERRQLIQARFLQFMLESGRLNYREAARAIAAKSKEDNVKRVERRWVRRWHKWMQDPSFQQMVAEMAMMELRGGLPEVVAALKRRAAKGNVPAIKLALEASGFWSPRTTHDHTGEIGVTIKHAARPDRTKDEAPVVDATVVE